MRPSLSSPSGEARTQYAATGYDYNLKLGPTYLTIGTSLGLEYNDNINLADSRATGEAAPKSDFIYRPAITLHTIWPATKLNVLTFDLGLGVERYLTHPDYNRTNVTISPNTQLSFDVYVGNIRLNFHDRLSVSQNAATRADASNTGPYSQTTNTSGLTALWDLNTTILQAGYDFTINRYSGSTVQNQNSTSNSLNLSISFPIAASLSTGLQANYIATSYENSLQPNLTTVSVGPFFQIALSRYTRFQVSGGYQTSNYEYAENAPTTTSSSPGGSLYYNASINNQLNKLFSQYLSVSKENQLGIDANVVQTSSVNYSLQWRMNSRITLDGTVSYQIGNQQTGLSEEKFHYLTFGLSFGYQLSRKLSVAVNYTNTQRTSNQTLRDYTQDVLGLNFNYRF